MTTTTPTCANPRCSRPVARKGQKCSICKRRTRRSASGNLGRGGARRAADVLTRGTGNPYSVNGSYYDDQAMRSEVAQN